MIKKCLICNQHNFKIIWKDKIRSGQKSFTKKKEIIYKCKNCNLVFLKRKRKKLENSAIARNIYNNNNSIEEFLNFHKPRELKKLNLVKKFINFKNKHILESNCGAGVLLKILKKKSKTTSGIDNTFYKNTLEKNGHNFFSSFDDVIKVKKKFDIIFSLSELEHKYDPVSFLKKMKKALSNSGRVVLRIPNYENIYSMILGKDYYKYDYRTSHNYYFSDSNLSILFKRVGLKIESKIGFHEYEFNHLLAYARTKKRVNGSYKNILNKKDENIIKKNIENSLTSTSIVYILK